MQYRITTRLRPLRIGFLAGLATPRSFLRCVELSSALWGARYNPILPALESTEHWEENELRGPSTPRDVLDRWMRTFDSDIVAMMDDASPELPVSLTPTLRVFFNPITDWRTVLGANNGTDKYGIGYGVGLLELARDFAAKDAAFVRDPPRRLLSPTIRDHAALSAALFGRLDNSMAARYHAILAPAGHAEIEVDVDEALRYVANGAITPLSMSDRSLRNDHRRYDFYALREDDPLDLALFWNIRASEPGLIPITAEMLARDATLEQTRSIIARDDSYEDSPRRVLVGTLESHRLQPLLERLALQQSFVTHVLQPPDDEYGPSDFTPSVYAATQTTVIAADDERVVINVVLPDIDRVEWKTGFRFANDVALWSLQGNRLPADAIPRAALTNVESEPVRTERTPWRTGNDGFVFLPFRDMRDFEFHPPQARDLIRSFFADAGFTCGVSEQGMLLEQLLERVATQMVGGIVTHHAMHEVYRHLDGRGTIRASQLLPALQRNIEKAAALVMIDVLTTNGILAQGMIQQCPLCNQRPWFALDSLSDELRCEYCRGRFAAKLVASRKLEPAFRILPPLDVSTNRDGLLAVMALLNFVRFGFGSDRLTIGAGTKIKGNNVDQEYDLVILARGLARSPLLDVMFCESSAYAAFDDADFKRFDALLRTFPRALFAFATLREEVSDAELRRIYLFAVGSGTDKVATTHKVVLLTGKDLTPRGDAYRTEYQGPDLQYFVKQRSEEFLAAARRSAELDRDI